MQSGVLSQMCRAFVRRTLNPGVTKKAYAPSHHMHIMLILAHQIDGLVLPVTLKLFLNYGHPYPGFVPDVRPRLKWTVDDARQHNFNPRMSP